MTNRLKDIIPGVTFPNQCSFAPERQIIENVVIYKKVLHSMRKRNSRKGIMTIKIDLEKTYDRLSWQFIRDTLHKLGFPRQWEDNIMHCVESSKLSVLGMENNLVG